MFNSTIFEIVIAIVFIYVLISLICSIIIGVNSELHAIVVANEGKYTQQSLDQNFPKTIQIIKSELYNIKVPMGWNSFLKNNREDIDYRDNNWVTV